LLHNILIYKEGQIYIKKEKDFAPHPPDYPLFVPSAVNGFLTFSTSPLGKGVKNEK
jgi:hypothetical protein